MARAVGKTKKSAANPGRRRKAAPKDTRPWAFWTLAMLIVLLLIRLAVNAAELVPVHFDEAQYWAYGQELAWGYFSKPPLVGAVIRLTTEALGDSLFALRLASPIAHALIAWLIFLIARRLLDGATGFWAAMLYTMAPGVGVSAMIVSTDPIMMVFWALALWAFVRAEQASGTGAGRWWIVMGAAIGLGMLAKYTMLGFVAGVAGYLLFSAEKRDWKGLGVAAFAALVVFAPNLIWNAENSFATVTHVAEDATPAGSRLNPGKLAEFLGAQLGVIGIVAFLGVLWAFWRRRIWLDQPAMRLIAWQVGPLLGAMIVLSFLTRAQPNWAAPAYIGGVILAARWLLTRQWQRAMLWGQGALGLVAVALVWGLALLYSASPDWPRAYDPFKKMRIAEPFCERALAAMSEEGAEILLSNDRRRLSECMFLGGLGWDEIAVWNPDQLIDNHHELVATLYPGDERVMLMAVFGGADEITPRFADAREVETGTFRTHSDREIGFSLWVVEGFESY